VRRIFPTRPVHLLKRNGIQGLGVGAAVGAIVLVPTSAAARTTPQLSGYGTWTLAELGFLPRVVTSRETGLRPFVAQTFAYRLPTDARQGPGSWWKLQLHLRVRIDPRSPVGPVYVTASTNGRTCASIRFLVRRAHGRMEVISDALGLVKGREVTSGPTLTRGLRFENFLQYRGVRPGLNELELEVERTSRAKIRDVVFFRDSSLEHTRVGPASVRPSLFLPDASIHVGDAFDIRFRLIQTGGAELTKGTAAVDYNRAFLRLRGPARVPLRWRAHRIAVGAFSFEARRAGRPRAGVVFVAGGVSATAYLQVHVLRESGGFPTLTVVALVLACVLGIALLLAGLLLRASRR
jgi:hypothetical protein